MYEQIALQKNKLKEALNAFSVPEAITVKSRLLNF